MKYLSLPGTDLKASVLSLGCMRMNSLDDAGAARLLKTALEQGINFFDHADIYGAGACEEQFARAVRTLGIRRQEMLIQSKCGIRPGMYDFSKEHILTSVDGILRRLEVDYLDVLLLHRPDTLMEPEEVAQAFDQLYRAGKVRYFGVSNHNPMQMELLSQALDQKLVINQLQFSPTNAGMVDCGLNVNMENNAGINRDGSILEYCRLKKITIQPWSPFQFGFFQGVFLGNEQFAELNQTLQEMAAQKGVSDAAMVIAWILRHPARMQPIVGTTNVQRLTDLCRACEVELSREEWYAIYRAAGHTLP